jgi:hypothetical protein
LFQGCEEEEDESPIDFTTTMAIDTSEAKKVGVADTDVLRCLYKLLHEDEEEPPPHHISRPPSNPPLVSNETGDAMNEFTSNNVILAGSFPRQFLCRRTSFVTTGSLSEAYRRHLMGQFHRTAAKNGALIDFLANQVQRHAVAQHTNIAFRNNPELLGSLMELLTNEGFRSDVSKAFALRDGPEKIKLCRSITKKISPFVTLTGSKVPGSALTRKGSTADIYALSQAFGLPGFFITLALPWGVQVGFLRMSWPVASNKTGTFPSDVVGDFFSRFANGEPFDKQSGYDSISVPTDTLSLCARLKEDPVAAVEDFYRIINGLLTDLIGIPHSKSVKSDTGANKVPRWRVKGFFTTPYGVYAVIEVQGLNEGLHIHLVLWCRFNPQLMQETSVREGVSDAMRATVKKFAVSELQTKVHADRLINRGVLAKSNSSCPPRSVKMTPAAIAIRNGQRRRIRWRVVTCFYVSIEQRRLCDCYSLT